MLIDDLHDTLGSKSIRLKKGEYVFTQGQSVENIFCVIQGRVRLMRQTIEGAPIVIHVAFAGESIAEASLFSEKYHCSALVDIGAEIAVFSKKTLLNRLQTSPKLTLSLLQQMTVSVRDLRMLNEIKSIYSAQERVLTFLRAEFKQEQELDLSLKDIAQKIGLSHEAFYRTIKTLETEGRICRSGRHLELVD